MCIAGRMAAELLVYLGEHVKAGIATMDLEVSPHAAVWTCTHMLKNLSVADFLFLHTMPLHCVSSH